MLRIFYRMTYEGLQQCLTLKNLLQNDLLWRIYNKRLMKDYETVSLSEGFITERLVMKNYYSV